VARDLRERSIDTYDSTEYRTIECLRSTICPPVNQGMIAHCASAVSEILWAGSTAGGLPESESRRMTGCIPTGLMSPHLRRLLRAPIPILLAVGARIDQGPENNASRKSDRRAARPTAWCKCQRSLQASRKAGSRNNRASLLFS